MSMAGRLVCSAVLLLGLSAGPARGQYDDMDFDAMMGGYGDMYGGGYGGMGDMMPGLEGMMGGMGGMMGGMGGMGGMGYGGYGYGDTEPAHTDLTDMSDVEKFMDADPQLPCVIAYYSEDKNSEDIMAFRTTAARMSQMGVRFGLATEDDVLETLKYTSGRVMAYPAKRFLAAGERPKQRYPGGGTIDPESLQLWILKAVTPLVGLFTWQTGIRYEELGLPELTAFTQVDLEEKGEEFDELAASLRRVASARPKKDLAFVVGNSADLSSLMDRFKFPVGEEGSEGKNPVFVGIRKDNVFYRMDGEFSEEAVAAFADAFVKGSLTPTHVEIVEDEESPESAGEGEDEDDDDDVVVLTADNFEEIVMEEGKDVMLEFYAPWCGHCKSLKPLYSMVAADLSNTPSIVVAKMDADKHTPPAQFEIKSFPTLMFLKAGDKSNPIPYEGARDPEAMVAFIREHASTPAVADA